MDKQAKWADIPFLSTIDLLGWMRSLLSGKNENIEIPDIQAKDIEEAIEIAHVYLSMYETWDTGFFGAPITHEAFRTVMMVKDQKLNLTNNVWKRNRIILEPVIANCTNACTTFESVYMTSKRNITEDVIHMLWALRAKRYDFIPWLLFVMTGDTGVWITASVVVGKAGSGENYEKFKTRLLGRG